ncbi:Ig-like domain-containing protein, partial [Nonomuraea sp. NPDC050202]|uniref:Ig-like domain-containing protein n=1 Tax=Nonomuraea sp. NPDC050202 TaxID=3155035 RepID=UPI0033E728A6
MTTVANPDGKTVGTYVFQAPVRFKDGTGNWRAIDTTLVQDGGVIKPKALKDEVRLSVGGDTGLLKVKTAEAEARLGAVRNLPAPTLAGNTATYTDAYGKGIDLLLEVGPAGVRQKVVIKQRPTGQLTLRVPVDPGDGLKYRSKSGQAEVLDDGKKIADIFPAVLVDATAAESAATGKIGHATAEFDGDDLVYRPDAAFLTDPATTYPVTLLANPTPWYGAGYPSDTFVSNDSRFTVGGAQQYMDAILAGRNNYDGESSYYIYRSYLKYNLTEAPWYGRPILNADLRPWNYITTHCGGDENTPKMAVRRVTSNWELNGSSSVNLRWDRQPSVTTTGEEVKGGGVGRIRKAGGTYVYCSQPAQELYYSIEDIVTAWATGSPNYGLQLAAYGDSGGTSNFREYLSTEWAGIDGRGPVLFVEYDAPSPKQAKGIFIPYEDNPTVGDDRDSTFTSDTAPVADALTEAEALKQIEAAPDYVMEDSALALGVPEDMTAEEWLESIEAVHETPGDPPDPEPGPDTTPPTVAGTYPEPDSTGVPYATTIRAGFNEEVSEARIEVKDPAGTTVTGNTAMDETNKVLSFQPAQPLLAETVYTAEVSGARDAAGNTMISPYRWSFTTAEADRTPPAVTSTIPENGATQVIVSEPVIASFSEPVKDAQITLKAPGGASVAGTAGMDAERRTLTFSPAQVLAAGTTYTVEVSGAKDEAGNVMAPHTWSFTTGANCAAPIVSDLQVRPSTSRGSITTTSTLTPELLARVVEDHGCASTLEVQVEHDPDYGEETGLIWSGSTSGVASGYVGAVQVPAGKLSDGQWLRWRARATAGGASGPWSDWQLLNV